MRCRSKTAYGATVSGVALPVAGVGRTRTSIQRAAPENRLELQESEAENTPFCTGRAVFSTSPTVLPPVAASFRRN